MLTFPSIRMTSVLLLALSVPPSLAQQPAAATSATAVTPEAMTEVDWSGLSAAQKQLIFEISQAERCDCACGFTLVDCRIKDAKCRRSLTLVNQMIALVKQGKGKDEIVRTVLEGPWRHVQFALSPGEAPSVGPTTAKVSILYYLDYQCPFCTKVEPTVEQILKEYPQDVRISFKMDPLDIHPNATIAAQGALAAQAQGKFLEMHRKLFGIQKELSREKVLALAGELGLDMKRFTQDLDAESIKTRITRETKEVQDLGATGTPAFFINGRYVSGAKAFSFFQSMIDEELAWARNGNRPQFKIGKKVSDAKAPPQSGGEQAGPDPAKVYDIPVGKAWVDGPATAKVTVLHYMDYQCPFCVKVGPTLERLRREYPADVRIAYKQYPIPSHPQAMIAAEAAMAAQSQGKFLEMHNKLMENSRGLSRDKILELAKGLGLDNERLVKELDGHVHKAAIEEMVGEAKKVGATGTPASFVNGRFISGAQPYEKFKALVDEVLLKQKAEK